MNYEQCSSCEFSEWANVDDDEYMQCQNWGNPDCPNLNEKNDCKYYKSK